MNPSHSSSATQPPPDQERIKEIFPDLEITSLEKNEDGVTNDLVVVNSQWVCRFPKEKKSAWESFERELKVLKLASDRMDIPAPKLEKKGADYLAYRYIDGEPLLQHKLKRYTEEEQDSIAEQFANILRPFHLAPASDLRKYGIIQSPRYRSPQLWREFYGRVEKQLMPYMRPHNRKWVRQHFAPVLKNHRCMQYEPRLINADLGPQHILSDHGKMAITGWIDFGMAGIGDPAIDFAAIIYYYGESFLKRMAKHYSEIEEAVDRARFWAGTFELEWILGFVRTKKLQYSLFHFGSANDAKPIGCPL